MASATGPSTSAVERRTMVDRQIRTFDVTDQVLISRILEVPREAFLPAHLVPLAYSDTFLRLKPGQAGAEPRAMLPPLILARMIQGASVRPTDKVLDVASGCGYTAAILAGLAGEVVALESESGYVSEMRKCLDAGGLQRVRTIEGSLAAGAQGEAPFDVILINGAIEDNLESLFAQLKPRGRLVAIQCLASDPAGCAGKAMRFEAIGGEVSHRALFDATAPVLSEFRRKPAFVF